MTREELEQIAQNQRAKQFLHVLSIMEGTAGFEDPYRALGGSRGKMFTSFADHPANLGYGKWRYQTLDGGTGPSTANGRYQFIRSTWNDQARQLGLKDFSPHSQDLAALNIIARSGQMNNILNGNWLPALKVLGGTWASLPTANQAVTNQAKGSWQRLANAFATAGINPAEIGMTGRAMTTAKYPASYVGGSTDSTTASLAYSLGYGGFGSAGGVGSGSALRAYKIQPTPQERQAQPHDPYAVEEQNYRPQSVASNRIVNPLQSSGHDSLYSDTAQSYWRSKSFWNK